MLGVGRWVQAGPGRAALLPWNSLFISLSLLLVALALPAPAQAQAGSFGFFSTLRITEIMFNPLPSNDAENIAGFTSTGEFQFIEFLNVAPSGPALDLTNLTTSKGFDYTFPPGTSSPSSSFNIVNSGLR